jgi:hypothetical protein
MAKVPNEQSLLTRLGGARKRFTMWLVIGPWLGLLWLSARIYPEGKPGKPRTGRWFQPVIFLISIQGADALGKILSVAGN